MSIRIPNGVCCALLLGAVGASLAQAADVPAAPADALRAGFEQPPAGARPRVWWHWMNGNITKEGIQLDLQWMHDTGLGGFQNFDAALATPQVVEKRLVFMTPEWKDAFGYTMKLADQLGLEAAIAGSPGWSESGGPWVQPGQGMKKVVWSETVVEGGKPFAGKLAAPPANSGPFLDAPFVDMMAPAGATGPSFYADTVVLAFRQTEAEAQPLAARAKVSSSGGPIDAAVLADGGIARSVAVPKAPVGQSSWIQFDFGQPVGVRAVTFAGADHSMMEQFNGGPAGPMIQSSSDGQTWTDVVQVPNDGAARHTLAFPTVTARWFRANWVTQPKAPPIPGFDIEEMFGSMGIEVPKPSPDLHVAELRFEAGARVLRGEEKAGFGLLPSFDALATPPMAVGAIVAKDSVVDLSGKMRPDGTLDWTPPAGRWVVLRMGYSPTGITNHPASPEGTGLEVDKLSRTDVHDYMSHYLDLYQDASGGLMGKRGLQYVISDSYEAGAANWTEDMLAQFQKRRGYDATPWLPVLTGRVEGTSAQSDRFLWDWRRTLSELIAENHYGQITDMLHERGMGHYGESHESGRAFIGDGMEAKKTNDVPMSAMWTQFPGVNQDNPGYNADIRESASVAHLYGQNLVAAESMTAAAGAWRWSPATLKPTADKEMAMGLNRFVIHTSVHQPLVDKGPGLALGPFGQWFTRNETWAGAGAKAWISYLARSSYMLQQGRFVADVAWFYGEDSNITALYGKAGPPVPEGYNFDYVNGDALQHQLKVIDGQLGSPSGARYRVLALDARAAHMSLPVLKAIRDLVSAGAVVVGQPPVDSPSLADDPAEFQAIVKEVWGERGPPLHRFGKGQVYGNSELGDVLAGAGVQADFGYTKPQADTQLLAVHRKLADGDLYFVDSRNDKAQALEASFRVTGLVPELWHAETGRSEAVAWHVQGKHTVVPLQLGPWESVFVVFRKPTQAASGGVPATRSETVATLDGSWHVAFQAGRHAPASAELPLGSWSDSKDEGIRYFAGTGTYSRTLDVKPAWLGKGAQLWLDLGDVHELAEVIVNGKSLGVAWRPPYRVDIASALHAGSNTLEIAVTDLWVNRLIRDAQPDVKDAFTFTVPKFYKGAEPLVPAGLVGPVKLERVAPVAAK